MKRICILLLIFISIFYVGFWWGNLRQTYASDWIRGYCWGYVEGRLEQKIGKAYKHNVLLILGIE